MPDDQLQIAINERAHALWEAEGRPAGRSLEHWLKAEREVRADTETAAGGLRVPVQCAELEPEPSTPEVPSRR
jgi:hypothetical protein